ncbi:MAG: hypothetical protein B7X08_02595 [Acidocella sp. 20-63-7]|nr:MAG: hypothetical protein B7X08_02595 [Acidocella sp. 20-63-7]HQT46308.1 PaaI family thioesterase [Acidocella sp.]
MSRTRTTTWEDPHAAAAHMQTLSGLEALHAMASGEIPPPPIIQLLGITLTSIAPGHIVMQLPIGEHLYNGLGTVHGGTAATLLDSVMGCAIQSLLPRKRAFTTLELKVSYQRAITQSTGLITAEGHSLSVGRKAGFAEGRITDASGKLYATASTTCAIWDL